MTTVERAKEILAEIRKDDPQKEKAWGHTVNAYLLGGYKISSHEFSTGIEYMYHKDDDVDACAPLWEDLNAMREFERYIFDLQVVTGEEQYQYYHRYTQIVEILVNNKQVSPHTSRELFNILIAPADVRLAAWIAVMEKK